MTTTITIRKRDSVYLQIDCPEKSVIMELAEHFQFHVPNHRFMKKHKGRKWDGKIRLFKISDNSIYVGLFPHVCAFAKARGYDVEVQGPMPIHIEDVDMGWFDKNVHITANGKHITPYEYQIKAVKHALTHKRGVLLSPTASGKSLIIYLIVRYYLHHHHQDSCLIIVPTTSLVQQMIKDFDDYSTRDPLFNAHDHCYGIFEGRSKEGLQSRVVVATWQSIHNMDKEWFDRYGCVLGDEAHGFKAKSLTSIMTKLTGADYRIGTTGTLDGMEVNRLVLEGLFGPIKEVTSTHDLMKSGNLAGLMIRIHSLKYPRSLIEESGSSLQTYQDQIDFITQNPHRNRYITTLVGDIESGNTLVLFQYVEKHGKPLYQMIMDRYPDRHVFYVSGESSADHREGIRSIVEKESNAIIVASMGSFSTGINIRNLHSIIFASPSKSQIRILQSIGRGLRLSDNGQNTTLYDLVDDLGVPDIKNYIMEHGVQRIKIYSKSRFKYTITEKPL